MSFEDLPPEGAKALDLSDPRHAADVIDLITLVEDRDAGCLTAMLCDDRNRGVQPVCLDGLGPRASPEAMVELLRLLLPLVAQAGGSVLLARGRPGQPRATEDDRRWHRSALDLCREHGVELLGFHVATRQGVCRLPDLAVGAA